MFFGKSIGMGETKKFFHLFAHDVVNPLDASYNYIDAIIDKLPPGSPELSLATRAMKSIRRSIDTVRNYSYIAKLEESVLAGIEGNERCNLLDIVKRVSEDLLYQFSDADLNIEVLVHLLESAHPGKKFHQLNVDNANLCCREFTGGELGNIHFLPYNASIIEPVIYNLLQNACKYSDPNSGKVTVDIVLKHKPELSDGSLQVHELSTENNGQLIPEDLLPTLFEPHTRGNLKVPGTGLGLYIVKRLLSALGLEIYVERDANRFRVMF